MLAVEAAGQPTYVAPTAGVLTSFTHVANSQSGQVRVIVFGPSSTANHKTIFGKSPKFSVTINASNTFAILVPMRAGESVGIGTTANLMGCVRGGSAGDTSWLAPFDPDLSDDFGTPPHSPPTGHTLLITTVSTVGIAQLTPAKVKLRIVRRHS